MSAFSIIDTHCHINMPEFDSDRDEVLDRCRREGVKAVIVASTVGREFQGLMEMSEQYELLYYMVGVHPHEAKSASQFDYYLAETHLEKERCCGVGEIGLDYHYGFSPRNIQRDVFSNFLDIALSYNVPVSIHSREATADTVDILQSKTGLRGVIHCFSGDMVLFKLALDIGLYFGIGGVLTFKNSALRKVIRGIPLDRIVVETDAPYLAPVPVRGKRNEPVFLKYIIAELSELLGIPSVELCDKIYENTLKLFFSRNNYS